MDNFAIKYIKIGNICEVSVFSYFLGFLVASKLTLGDYCLDQANSSSLNQCFSKRAISPPCGRKRNTRGRKAKGGQ